MYARLQDLSSINDGDDRDGDGEDRDIDAKCFEAHPFTKCYKSWDCAAAGSEGDVKIVLGTDPANCPAGTISYSINENKTCIPWALQCFSDRTCTGTPAIGKDSTGGLYSH
eukprot:tig00001307_g8125.t1